MSHLRRIPLDRWRESLKSARQSKRPWALDFISSRVHHVKLFYVFLFSSRIYGTQQRQNTSEMHLIAGFLPNYFETQAHCWKCQTVSGCDCDRTNATKIQVGNFSVILIWQIQLACQTLDIVLHLTKTFAMCIHKGVYFFYGKFLERTDLEYLQPTTKKWIYQTRVIAWFMGVHLQQWRRMAKRGKWKSLCFFSFSFS